MNLAVQIRPFGPHPLLGIGVDELRRMAAVRPGDTLHLEGEVVGLTPSRTKPQGIVLVKWTVFNQSSEAVYTFTPIAIVPRRPQQPRLPVPLLPRGLPQRRRDFADGALLAVDCHSRDRLLRQLAR